MTFFGWECVWSGEAGCVSKKHLVVYCEIKAYEHIQSIRKVFTVLQFFHILLCYSLIPKWIKFIIFF